MKKIILPALLICLHILLHAQKANEPAGITAEQKAKLMSIMYEIDGKLKPVVSADAKQQSQMQQELTAIAAIKDVKQRSSATTAYQQKYKALYGAMLKKAGVDMAKYLKLLNSSFPGYQFMLSGDFSIIGKGRTVTPPSSQPAGPVTTQIKTFTTSKSVGCGGIGGGSVTFTSNSMKVSGFATVAGGCNNTGSMVAEFTVPAASSASIIVKHLLKADGFAVGVLGTGITTSTCYFYSGTTSTRISVLVMAPVLWVAGGEDEINETLTIPVSTNASRSVSYHTQVTPMSGLPSEAQGNASVTGIGITLTTQP
jgi:hypothetical protein